MKQTTEMLLQNNLLLMSPTRILLLQNLLKKPQTMASNTREESKKIPIPKVTPKPPPPKKDKGKGNVVSAPT